MNVFNHILINVVVLGEAGDIGPRGFKGEYNLENLPIFKVAK